MDGYTGRVTLGIAQMKKGRWIYLPKTWMPVKEGALPSAELLTAYPSPLNDGYHPPDVEVFARCPPGGSVSWVVAAENTIELHGKGGIPLQHSYMTREEYDAMFNPFPHGLVPPNKRDHMVPPDVNPEELQSASTSTAEKEWVLQILEQDEGNPPPFPQPPPPQPQPPANQPAQPPVVNPQAVQDLAAQILAPVPPQQIPPPPVNPGHVPLPPAPALPNVQVNVPQDPWALLLEMEPEEHPDWRARHREDNYYFCQDCQGFWLRAQQPYFELRRLEIRAWRRQHPGSSECVSQCDTCMGIVYTHMSWNGTSEEYEHEGVGTNRDADGEWVYVGGQTIVVEIENQDPITKCVLWPLRRGRTPAYCEHWIDQWSPDAFFTYPKRNQEWERVAKNRRSLVRDRQAITAQESAQTQETGSTKNAHNQREKAAALPARLRRAQK